MMLSVKIMNGVRQGRILNLPIISSIKSEIPWLKENEAVEFKLTVSELYKEATLELYDHAISSSYAESKDGYTTFIWTPNTTKYQKYDCLFINYFGIAELSVSLSDIDGNVEIFHFQLLEVLASKLNSDAVENMFNFLSTLSDENLHSLFQTTKHGAGFKDGGVSPKGNLEKLEQTVEILQYLIPQILQKPITRLVPEQELISPTGNENLDDSSLGWLLSNLSVLEEVDNVQEAHLESEGNYYRASSLQLHVLKDNSDLYENHVVHGFVEVLIHETKVLINKYHNSYNLDGVNESTYPSGYLSFFSKVSKFQKHLIGSQVRKCEQLSNTLINIKHHLDVKLPVRKLIVARPKVTPKVNVNSSYRHLFSEVIKWHEKSKPDWSVYENLLAIQSIPILFETYCYFRVSVILNSILKSDEPDTSDDGFMNLQTFFIDDLGVEVQLQREPVYWMPDNKHSIENNFINSEGQTIRYSSNEIVTRSHIHKYSHRKPDFVIEIKNTSGVSKLIILDAKYTSPFLAFSKYLPECTMKYVHGIHSIFNINSSVTSFTILHPCNDATFRSFHSMVYSVFGKNAVSPSLQTVGLSLGSQATGDKLEELLISILKHNGVSLDKRAKDTIVSQTEYTETKRPLQSLVHQIMPRTSLN
jgi:hypothetical protein